MRRAFHSHGTELAWLAIAAAGLALTWMVSGMQGRPPPGVLILAAGMIACLAMPGRAGSLVGLLAAGLVGQQVALGGQLADLMGLHGAAVAGARWLEAAGLLLAMAAAVRRLVRAPQRDAAAGDRTAGTQTTPGRDLRVLAQVGGVLVLSAVGAELLAAYDDSTGRVGPLLFAVAFFGALYGAPALLIRELARGRGWGWPSLILLAFAPAILQPAVIDQALFSEAYRNIEGWSDSRNQTFIAPLGLSVHMAQNFVLGHVIYSFCAPLAVVEAWRPASSSRRWLGVRGTVAAAVLYVGAAALIMNDPESRSASTTQVIVSLLAAVGCVCAAAWVGRRGAAPRKRQPGGVPTVASTLLGTLIVALLASVGAETWTGVAMVVGGTALIAVMVGRLSRRAGWTVHHAAAVAFGFLLCRGLLAFTYFPLVGDVSATRKYAHNVAMLAIVGLAGWLAVRRAPQAGGELATHFDSARSL